MSLETITQATRDQALRDRVDAGVWRETIGNPEFGDTEFGASVRAGWAPIGPVFMYPVAVDTEDEYASALAAGNPNPGGDPSVITDAMIGSAVQAHWPPDAVTTP